MVEIKICGITDMGDALHAARCGADALGFIFYPGSPRYVAPEKAREIIRALPGGVCAVGVFVNEDPGEVKRIAEFCGLDLVQLHGDETPEYCRRFPEALLIKALSPRSEEDAGRGTEYRARAILVDARTPGLFGGTGKKADWRLAAILRDRGLLVLSGGLDRGNILEALGSVRPDAVDICSGAERSPGRKDPEKVREVIGMIRASGPAGRAAKKIFQKREGERVKQTLPDERGHFGIFGGRYVAETLMPVLLELERSYAAARDDEAFRRELDFYLREYAGRRTPLFYAENLTRRLGGARIYLKREDLNHTGAHKINNTLGQVLLARRMGKGKVIAETGAGQHGVAAATAAALFGMECRVFMGEEDIGRQAPNVLRMKILGADVVPVSSGTATLKDAMNEAMRFWVAHVRDTFYVIGSTAGPHPYPMMVRDFQSVIGKEARAQILDQEGRLPDFLVACVGGGSNAMGLFHPFRDDRNVAMIGVEAAGLGIESGKHAASITAGRIGVLHGNKTYLLQDGAGQVLDAHSIAAGLDYPGVGPEHSHFHSTGRAAYVSVTDDEAMEAFIVLTRCEGIIPAMESAHAVAYAMKLAPTVSPERIIVVNLSGRGDKDLGIVAGRMGYDIHGTH